VIGKGPTITDRQKYLRMLRLTVGTGVPPAWQEVFYRGLMEYDRIMNYVLWGFASPPARIMEDYYRHEICTARS